MVLPVATVVCLNCFLGYPISYCELELTEGCISTTTEEINLELSSESQDGDKEYRDPISTGRKRAARLYPIAPGMVCEWSWRKDCGGGAEPIIGCTGRPASNIHHGPDKSTLNNQRENISVICTFCHNRWHVANDKYYGKARPLDETPWLQDTGIGDRPVLTLADSKKATKQEILMNEMMIPEGGKDKK